MAESSSAREVSRRGVLAGAAWATPALPVATAVPAHGAMSQPVITLLGPVTATRDGINLDVNILGSAAVSGTTIATPRSDRGHLGAADKQLDCGAIRGDSAAAVPGSYPDRACEWRSSRAHDRAGSQPRPSGWWSHRLRYRGQGAQCIRHSGSRLDSQGDADGLGRSGRRASGAANRRRGQLLEAPRFSSRAAANAAPLGSRWSLSPRRPYHCDARQLRPAPELREIHV